MKPSIVVTRLSKQYRLGVGLTSLRELFAIRKVSRSPKYRWVVDDVSFELQPGESLGIIGPNGAGKTTILKMLSRVTQPTSGQIEVNGRMSALIELGAGFHPDLTGRENIFLNGTIVGMRRAEIKARFDEIVDFAGIGEFLDTPVKRYSSGMYARLGFSIAAHVGPQVLLVDEVLAVGDFAFQTKCYSLMERLRENGTAMILVSHNMDAMRRVCDRGLVMYRGKAIFQGGAGDAIVAYSGALRQSARQSRPEVPNEGGIAQRIMTFDAEVESVEMLDEAGRPTTTFQSGTTAIIAVNVLAHKQAQQPILSLTVRTTDGRVIYDTTTRWMKIRTPDFCSGERYRITYTLGLPLLSGTYEVRFDIASSNFSHFYDYLECALTFSVVGTSGAQGLVDLGASISIKETVATGQVA